jgi:hypothetical protein
MLNSDDWLGKRLRTIVAGLEPWGSGAAQTPPSRVGGEYWGVSVSERIESEFHAWRLLKETIRWEQITDGPQSRSLLTLESCGAISRNLADEFAELSELTVGRSWTPRPCSTTATLKPFEGVP